MALTCSSCSVFSSLTMGYYQFQVESKLLCISRFFVDAGHIPVPKLGKTSRNGTYTIFPFSITISFQIRVIAPQISSVFFCYRTGGLVDNTLTPPLRPRWSPWAASPALYRTAMAALKLSSRNWPFSSTTRWMPSPPAGKM